MTLVRPLDYRVGPSAFPPARFGAAERALFANPKITDRFVPEALGKGGNIWRSIKRRDPDDKDSASVLHLAYGQMPTYEATGGPAGHPCALWPVGIQGTFEADGITLPTALSGSFTIACVVRAKQNTETDSTVASSKGSNTEAPGRSFWGLLAGGGGRIARQSPHQSGSTYTHQNNVAAASFDDGEGKDWLALVWTRRGHPTGNADMQTFYGGTTGGVFGWKSSSVGSAALGYTNSTLMIGGSVRLDDGGNVGGSSSWDFALADLIIMEGQHVMDDTDTLDQIGAVWFPQFFGG